MSAISELMPCFDVICLANSRKQRARCVAGIRTDTGEWVRPVSDLAHGELEYRHRKLANQGEPQNFDVIRIGVHGHKPLMSQPENWLIDGSPWQLLNRPAPSGLHEHLRARLFRGRLLFGCASDRISVARFAQTPASGSLLLIKPNRPRWVTTWKLFGGKQLRVIFQLAGTTYDLVVTDPVYEQTAKNLGIGDHTSCQLGISDEDGLLFTISLGEEFKGSCYKLVAAVLQLPAGWPPVT